MYEMPEDISEARKTVKLTKMSIEELGHVNLNAIEQFKEVNDRYTFLSDQRTDLLLNFFLNSSIHILLF